MKNIRFLLAIIAIATAGFTSVTSSVVPSDRLVTAVATKMIADVAQSTLSTEIPEHIDSLASIVDEANSGVLSAVK